MNRTAKQIEDKKPSLPTPKEMTLFASLFTKDEWRKLCNNKVFLNTVTEDLSVCRILAEKLLSEK